MTLNGGLISRRFRPARRSANAVSIAGANITFGEKIAAKIDDTLTLSGAVTLTQGNHNLTFAAAATNFANVKTIISGAISGDGGFTKLGPSTLELAGTTANTYTGTTTVLDGTSFLDKTSKMKMAAVAVTW